MIPNAYSQQLWLPESSSDPKVKKETFVSAGKDASQPRKYSTRRNMHVKLTGKVQGKSLKDLNKALLECLDDFKWPLSTNRNHVFEQSEADERIQFGVTNSYSGGIVLSAATGNRNA